MAKIFASFVCLFSLLFFSSFFKLFLLRVCAQVCTCGGGYRCCITGMLIVFFTSLASLASHAFLKHTCVGGMPSSALSTLPFALPALRYWNVKLCFLYRPCVTGMSNFACFFLIILSDLSYRRVKLSQPCVIGMSSVAFFTSLASRVCQALLSSPALRHGHVKLCFISPQLLTCQALLALRHGHVKLCCFFTSLASLACQALLSLPAWRHFHVRLCFPYQPDVTGVSRFAFFTSLASLACQPALLSLPDWRHWHVKLCFLYQPDVTGVSRFAFFTSLA